MSADGDNLSSGDYGRIIAEASKKIEEAEHLLRQIEGRRLKVALGALQGNQAAVGELEAIESDEAALRERVRNLRAALAEALRLHGEASALEGAAARRRAIRQTSELAEQAVAKCAEIDRAFEAVAPIIGERNALLDRIAALGVIDATTTGNLRHVSYTNSALAESGLAKLLGMGASPSTYGSLEKIARANLRIAPTDQRFLEAEGAE